MKTVICIVKQTHKLGCCFHVSSSTRVVVACWVFQYVWISIVVAVCLVLNGVVPPAMMVACLQSNIVCVRVTAISRKDFIEVKNKHFVVGVFRKPLIYQPIVEGSSISRIGGISQRGGCH